MATGKRFYWIKLKDTFMSSDTVDFLMSQKDGANYVVLYQMLCLKTINTEGRLVRQIGEVIIPYNVEKIQRDTKWFTTDTVRVALSLYQKLGLIYEDKEGTLVLADHHNMVGSETDYAAQKKMQRQNTAKLPPSTVDKGVDNVHTDIRDKDIRDKRLDNRDKSIESIVSADADNVSEADTMQNCPYQKIKDLYHSICISFPKIRAISGSREKAVAARWRTYKSLDVFKELFTVAESSSFLKGSNNRDWSADFDWMMKSNNFSKILEHKYDDRTAAPIEGSEITPTHDIAEIEKRFMQAYMDD